jgi:alpha-galactosidase
MARSITDTMTRHRPVHCGILAALLACANGALATPPALQPSGVFSIPVSPQAATPPMGWNPWNAFRTEVTEARIMAVAETLTRSGLAQAGYRYVNIDDGWWLRRRADGSIDVRTSMFPSAALPGGGTSLRPFTDRLHAMGLKAGLYTDIGRNACSQIWDQHSPNLPQGSVAEREIGSFGHQEQDMRLFFGDWNFDYLKVDACGLADYLAGQPAVRSGQFRALETGAGPYIVRGKPGAHDVAQTEALYAGLQQAIAAARPDGGAILSICTWGEGNVADWGKQRGHLWRTSPDIEPSWHSMLRNFDSIANRPLYAGPGHWNDPDMLEIGHGDFDADHLVEARAHMSLWAIASAPLLLGADLTKMPQSLLDIAGNRDVIAIDQDPAGNQGVTALREGDLQAIVKQLAAPGSKAVALVNRGASPAKIALPLERLGLDPRAPVALRNVWTRQAHPLTGNTIAAALAPHETVLLLAQGKPALKRAVYLSDMPARVNVAESGQTRVAAPDPNWAPAQADAAPSGAPLQLKGRRYSRGLGVLANSRLEVRLDQGYTAFRATAGVIDGSGTPGLAVSYRVYGDGKLLTGQRASGNASINVPVRGVRVLELVAETAPDEQAANPAAIAWADARLAY